MSLPVDCLNANRPESHTLVPKVSKLLTTAKYQEKDFDFGHDTDLRQFSLPLFIAHQLEHWAPKSYHTLLVLMPLYTTDNIIICLVRKLENRENDFN